MRSLLQKINVIMLDPQMRHHYQRLYNAKPSREIALTRPGSSSGPKRAAARRTSPLSVAGPTGQRRPSSSDANVRYNGSSIQAGKRNSFDREKSHSHTELQRCSSDFHNNSYDQRSIRAPNVVRGRGNGQPPRNEPGNFWTERYLDQELHLAGRGFGSSDEEYFEGHHNAKVTPPMPHSRSLQASLTELNSIDNANHNFKANMSNKIDQFLHIVKKFEGDLDEGLSFQSQRLEAPKSQQGWKRSASSFSNMSAGNSSNIQMHQNISDTTLNPPERYVQEQQPQKYQPRKKVASKLSSRSSSAAAMKAYGGESSSRLSPSTTKRGRSQSPIIKRPSSSHNSRISSFCAKRTVAVSQPPSSSTSIQPTQKHFLGKRAIPTFPLPDTSRVISKLLNDRSNYQPPRPKRAPMKVNRKRNPIKPPSDHESEYEDDFEDGDQEEDGTYGREFYGKSFEDSSIHEGEKGEEINEEERTMLMTKRWLDDQALRGIARRRALVKSKSELLDKESNKDSAYDFSGGESRLQTREPTPDTYFQHQQNLWRLQNMKLAKKHQREKMSRIRAQVKQCDSESEENSKAYVKLVNKVTGDILKRGVYTDKAVLETLEDHAKKCDNVSKKEVEIIFQTLKRELGLTKTELGNTLLGSNTSLENLLHTKIPVNSLSCPQRGEKMKMKVSNCHGKVSLVNSEALNELSDTEISSILNDVDLDDSIVEDLLRTIKFKEEGFQNAGMDYEDLESPGNLRLFDSLNITDMNISFNKSASSANEKNGHQKALMIKSFSSGKSHSKDGVRRQGGSSKTAGAGFSTQGKLSTARQMLPSSRQDSSSSNPDQATSSKKVPKEKPRPRLQQHQHHSLAMSSETPRSSSLYLPETDEEEKEDSAKLEDKNKTRNKEKKKSRELVRTKHGGPGLKGEEYYDSEISEDCEYEVDGENNPQSTNSSLTCSEEEEICDDIVIQSD